MASVFTLETTITKSEIWRAESATASTVSSPVICTTRMDAPTWSGGENLSPAPSGPARSSRKRDIGDQLARLGILGADLEHLTSTWLGHRSMYVARPAMPQPLQTVLATQMHSRGLEFSYRGFAKPGRQTVSGSAEAYFRGIAAGTWKLFRKGELRDADVVKHLAGDSTILGTGCRWHEQLKRFRTNFFMLDLDWCGSTDDLRQRYYGACTAFGRPTALFQSSDSGGWHAYWFLDQEVDLFALRNPSGEGAIARWLTYVGLREESGRVEIFPRGHFKQQGVQHRHRLAFGRGSVLLDPYTFEPITGRGPLADLKWMRRHFESGNEERLDAEALQEYPPRRPRAATTKTRKTSSMRPTAKRRARDGRDAMFTAAKGAGYRWRFGLTDHGEFNAAVTDLAYELRKGKQIDAADASRMLQDWIDYNHNGYSATYNTSPQSAYNEINEIVERAFAHTRWSGNTETWGTYVPPLTDSDVYRLLSLTRQSAPPVKWLVKEPWNWWVFSYGAFLLRRAKEWVIEQTVSSIRKLRLQHGPLTDTDALVGALHDCSKAFLPTGDDSRFTVPVPDALRASARGLPKNSRYPLWSALTGAGVFVLARKSSKHAHRAATYRVALDFDPAAVRQARVAEARDAAKFFRDDETRDFCGANWESRRTLVDAESGSAPPEYKEAIDLLALVLAKAAPPDQDARAA